MDKVVYLHFGSLNVTVFFPRTVVDIMIYVVNVERHLQK